MTNLGKNIAELLNALNSKWDALGKQLDAVMDTKKVSSCDHGVVFDEAKARSMTSYEIKKAYPRLDGQCPKGCGYCGIAYASSIHYYSGDW